MRRYISVAGVILVLVLATGAVGANPRYIEELAIGGGYGDSADGGAWIEKTGAIITDASITANGDAAFGENEAANHSIGVTAGGSSQSYLNLDEADSVHGGAIRYDGAGDKLYVGTRNGSATPVDAIQIAKGSANVKLLGNLTLGGTDIAGTTSVNILSTNAPLKLSPQSTSNGDCYLYLFRDTNTTAPRHVFLYKGDGTGTTTVDIEAPTGNITANGDAKFYGGDVDAGQDSTMRGVVTAWDGSGGSAPGCIKIASPNGTIWYLFVEDDGTVKVHNALPTSNSNGSVVGLQF